jgi:hypothetical protein
MLPVIVKDEDWAFGCQLPTRPSPLFPGRPLSRGWSMSPPGKVMSMTWNWTD